ncbi:SDR family oxidoreductase [Allohahella sp. A8]|uniref:SDR family oxidoreductase n=1 Tax=Allohahella sp. A8 TaxID=3141461 RepID=UPI003A80B79F
MSDKVILITGASSGIGAATARAASKAGYRVALAARSEDKLKSLQQELGGETRALALTCDVQDMAAQKDMVAKTLEHFGQLDVVFANAGRGGSSGGFSKADHESWRDMILTNVYGVGLTVQAALPALKKSKGHMVLTGSVAGRLTIPGSMYSATKWAVSAIGYGLKEEVRGTGVRVTLIEPGMVDTAFFDEKPENALEPNDIAEAVMYAISQPPHVDVNEIMVRPTPKIE